MVYTLDDLEALRAAYASGAMRVKMSDGKEVFYASGADLRRRIGEVEASLAASSAPIGRFAQFSR